MRIINMAAHNILLEEERTEKKSMETSEAASFFNKIIEEILNNETKKAYKISRETTEVVSIIKGVYCNENLNELEENIPARLLIKEIEAQQNIEKLKTKIKKGCLIQALIEKDEKKYFIISKIEATDGLDMNQFTLTNILPLTKKILKNCLFEFNEDGEISNIYLSDTNSNISRYWYDDFLELIEMIDDEKNTKDVFDIFLREIKNKLEKKSPNDYIVCRNSAISYFKTNDNFNFDNAINTIFGNYIFENDEFNNGNVVSQIKERIKNKIDSIDLDTEFTICPSVIKAKKKKIVKEIASNILLEVHDYLENIKSDIQAIEKEGNKYIIIRATNEETFESFKWRD